MFNNIEAHQYFYTSRVHLSVAGNPVQVVTKEGVHGTVISVPYPTRSDAESAMPPVKKKEEATGDDAAISLGLEEEKAKEAARKVWFVLMNW